MAKRLLAESGLGLRFKDGVTLGADARLTKVERDQSDTTWENKLGKRRPGPRPAQRIAAFSGGAVGPAFRIDRAGVRRWRWLPLRLAGGAFAAQTQDFVLEEEQTQFCFPRKLPVLRGRSMRTRAKPTIPLATSGRRNPSSCRPIWAICRPIKSGCCRCLVKTPAAWVAITESDLYDWAGMWVNRVAPAGNAGGVTLAARLSPRPDGQGLVKSTFPRHSPWRVLMIGRQPGRLVESDLISNLSTPCQLKDTSWIRPGMMAWDHWWTGDVKMDTATIKEYIQLAADMGWPYQLIDWQWYGPFNKPDADITKVNPAVDMDEVRRFARKRASVCGCGSTGPMRTATTPTRRRSSSMSSGGSPASRSTS